MDAAAAPAAAPIYLQKARRVEVNWVFKNISSVISLQNEHEGISSLKGPPSCRISPSLVRVCGNALASLSAKRPRFRTTRREASREATAVRPDRWRRGKAASRCPGHRPGRRWVASSWCRETCPAVRHFSVDQSCSAPYLGTI